MWSKTKKALMDRMADSLKERVRYNFEVYSTNKFRYWTKMKVLYIYVDDELWFATNPESWSKHHEYLYKMTDDERAAWPDSFKYASEYGLMDIDSMMRNIHWYLNDYSVKDCLESKNHILRMLAILDRRIGKRTIKQLVDNIDNEPEWLRKFIRLRAECEGIK